MVSPSARRCLVLAGSVFGALAQFSCAHSGQPAAVRTASPAPAARSAASTPPNIDRSSEAAFTRSVLNLFIQRDARGGWGSSKPLNLSGGNGFAVNLERVWRGCASSAQWCDDELPNFVDEVIRIAARKEEPVAPRSFFAIVRSKDYLESAPASVRAATLFEPFVADMIIVYVVDQGGSVRGAQTKDLAAIGIERRALPALAEQNLTQALPALPADATCEPNSVTVWATGNYYESSRLLLSRFWKDFAARSQARLVVAVPASDALIVACDPAPVTLAKLAGGIAELSSKAERPLSQALLQWTATGWQPLKP